MMMMTMPATIDSSADQVRTSAPTMLALAPSATNTVEKPRTNITAATITARRETARGSPEATCSTRRTGQVDEIGRHQRQHAGRQEADDARNERGEDGNVGSHGARCDVTALPCKSARRLFRAL